MSSARHDQAGIDDAELIEVADGVFGYIQPDGSWFINNTGFVAGLPPSWPSTARPPSAGPGR